MKTLDVTVNVIGIIATIGAGGFWLWASIIPVPDNLDTFIGELQRIGRVNAWGAMCACVAAFCATYAFARNF